MIKLTHRINVTITVKVVDLDTSCIYKTNHMVGMDKIYTNEACRLKCLGMGPTSLKQKLLRIHIDPNFNSLLGISF
jgi:hypothetical protein